GVMPVDPRLMIFTAIFVTNPMFSGSFIAITLSDSASPSLLEGAAAPRPISRIKTSKAGAQAIQCRCETCFTTSHTRYRGGRRNLGTKGEYQRDSRDPEDKIVVQAARHEPGDNHREQPHHVPQA